MRNFPDRPVVGVGAVVLDADRVLLVKRAHEPLKGEWSLPGGAVELGEALQAAVVREVREETGLEIEVGPVVDVVDRIERRGDARVEFHFVIIDYLCWPRGGRLTRGSDAADVSFAPLEALDDFRLTDTARQVIARAAQLHQETS